MADPRVVGVAVDARPLSISVQIEIDTFCADGWRDKVTAEHLAPSVRAVLLRWLGAAEEASRADT